MTRQNSRERKLEHLREYIGRLESVLVAFSGGVDSAFLLYVSRQVLGDKAVAATAVSEVQFLQELTAAREIARKLSVRHIVFECRVLSDRNFSRNSPERCYTCKKRIFEKIAAYAARHGLRHIIDGSNLDDAQDYRPGTRALHALGVKSPLQEALFTKAEIREASRALHLPTWNRPAVSCLASRIPYGTPITAHNLGMVRQAEDFLRTLGFRQFRVRHHGDIARIELSPQDMERAFSRSVTTEIVDRLKGLGYAYVALDLEGYRMGSLNEVLRVKSE